MAVSRALADHLIRPLYQQHRAMADARGVVRRVFPGRTLVLAPEPGERLEVDIRPGIVVLVIVVAAMFCTLAVLDFYFEWRRRRTLGQRLQTWTKGYPLYAAGLVLVLGALVGHFYSH